MQTKFQRNKLPIERLVMISTRPLRWVLVVTASVLALLPIATKDSFANPAAQPSAQYGDFMPQPLGTDLVSITAQFAMLKRNFGTEVPVAKNKTPAPQSPSPSTISQIEVAARWSHDTTVFDLPFRFTYEAPFEILMPSGRRNEIGMGDTSYAVTLWPYSNSEYNQNFGISLIGNPASGYYNKYRSISPSAGRYSVTLRIGYHGRVPFLNTFEWETAVGVTNYIGKLNTDFGRQSKMPQYELQQWINWTYEELFTVYVGALATFGGAERTNVNSEADINFKIRNWRDFNNPNGVNLRIGTGYQILTWLRVSGEVGMDVGRVSGTSDQFDGLIRTGFSF